MLTRWFHQFQTDWQNYANANLPVFPTVGAYEQTRKSWATQIRDYEGIPECYKPYYEALKQSHQPLPYTIKTPSFEGFFSPTTEKMITLMDDSLLFLDRVDRKTTLQQISLDQIGYVEYKSVLLASRIGIYGLDANHKPVRIEFRFNTVNDYLFQPIIEAFRTRGKDLGDGPRHVEEFDFLLDLNYKLMNYARRSLLPEEKVEEVVLQPAIERERFRLHTQAFTRMVSPAHLAIVTDREVIWIQDEPRNQAKSHYGGTWLYIHPEKLTKLTFANQGLDINSMNLHFEDGSRLEWIYDSDHIMDAHHLEEEIRERVPGLPEIMLTN